MNVKEIYNSCSKNKDFSLFMFLLCNTDEEGNITIKEDILEADRMKPHLEALKELKFIDKKATKVLRFSRFKHLLGMGNVKSEGVDYDEFQSFFNNTIGDRGIPHIERMTDKRKGLLNGRIKEHGVEKVRQVVINASASDFLNGMVTGITYGFDWIFRPNNFVKVLEGNYNNRTKMTDKERRVYEQQRDLQGSADYLAQLDAERQRQYH